jgi:hypothetical protein
LSVSSARYRALVIFIHNASSFSWAFLFEYYSFHCYLSQIGIAPFVQLG